MLRGSRPSESCSINRRLDTWRRITGDRVKRRGNGGGGEIEGGEDEDGGEKEGEKAWGGRMDGI